MPPPSPPLSTRDGILEPRQNQSQPSTVWMIAPIIAGTVLLTLIAVFLIRHVLKLRKQRHQHASSSMTTAPGSPGKEWRRKRNMSYTDGLGEDEEEQRAAMIRKSLAQRSPKTGNSSTHTRYESISSLTSMLGPSMSEKSAADDSDSDGEEDVGSSRRVSGGLRDDWKEFEARVQRERSNSGELHPAAVPYHPDLSAPAPCQDLALPGRTVTRSRSSSHDPPLDRPPLPAHAMTTPPAGEQSYQSVGIRGGRGERPRSEIPGITVHQV